MPGTTLECSNGQTSVMHAAPRDSEHDTLKCTSRHDTSTVSAFVETLSAFMNMRSEDRHLGGRVPESVGIPPPVSAGKCHVRGAAPVPVRTIWTVPARNAGRRRAYLRSGGANSACSANANRARGSSRRGDIVA